jgi:hypothetical protein
MDGVTSSQNQVRKPRHFFIPQLLGLAAIVTFSVGVADMLWGFLNLYALLLVVGFLMNIAFVILSDKLFGKTSQRNDSRHRAANQVLWLRRTRLLSNVLIGSTFLGSMMCCVLLMLTGWIVSDGRPVFERRPAYYGTSRDGDIRILERDFRTRATIFWVGSWLFQLCFTEIGFHVLYFGEWPLSNSTNRKEDGESHVQAASPNAGLT